MFRRIAQYKPIMLKCFFLPGIDRRSSFIFDIGLCKESNCIFRKIGLDYAHGTGHGVGYFLNVHEGPHAISKNNKIKFKEGMIVSNEPGYYKKNHYKK